MFSPINYFNLPLMMPVVGEMVVILKIMFNVVNLTPEEQTGIFACAEM